MMKCNQPSVSIHSLDTDVGVVVDEEYNEVVVVFVAKGVCDTTPVVTTGTDRVLEDTPGTSSIPAPSTGGASVDIGTDAMIYS